MDPTFPHSDPPSRRAAPRGVLIVSDDATLRDATNAVLTRDGYPCLVAGTGADALSTAATSDLAAVVVDDTLPDVEGAAVIGKLRELSQEARCILVTSSLERASRREVLESGADAYVLGSQGPEAIAARLRALVGPIADGSDAPRTPAGTPCILAVDDSPAALQLLVMAFDSDGYEMLLAHSGEEALEVLRRRRVDCALLDLMMPGMSGTELCRRIKATASWRDLPVLMLTVREDEETMLTAIEAGADDYIIKSSSFEIVRARVQSQLRRREYEEENRRIREALHHKELETLRERAAREFAQSSALALTDLDRLKDEFLSIVSHDLRTPLAVISGAVSNVMSGVAGPLTEDQRHFLDMAKQSTHRLNQMIADLLDLSRIQAGALVLRRDRLDLREAVTELTEETRPLAREAGVTVELDLPDRSVDMVADAGRFGQVVVNLVSNACRFARNRVGIRLSSTGSMAVLEVEDDGPGIPPDAFGLLFKRFSRVAAHGPKSKTGLGLSIVKAIAEAHGGAARAENVRDEQGAVRGARFTVAFPLDGPLETRPVGLSRRPPPHATRVLLVEDESDLRRIVSARLRALGCEVVEAGDAETALELVAQMPVDLAVLDIGLPGMDGLELGARLRDGEQAPAILFMTARDDGGSRARGRDLGAIGYLTKPFDPADLAREVRTALRLGDVTRAESGAV